MTVSRRCDYRLPPDAEGSMAAPSASSTSDRVRPSTDIGRCFHADVRTSALPRQTTFVPGLMSVASSTRADVGEALALAIRGCLLVRTDVRVCVHRNRRCSRDSMLALPLCYSASVFLHSMAVVGRASTSCQTEATSCRSSEIVATIASNSASRSGWCFRKYCCAGLFSRSFAR
jgi:hypothetical protein